MNFIFISPHFPNNYYLFCKELKLNGANVLGIASDNYNFLANEVKESLTEYYKVDNMEDYNQMYKAVAYFASKYGKIDFIESNNEYWLELDARLRTDFNVTTGKKIDEINFFKSKEAMKKDYQKAKVKVARYHIPTTLSEGKKFIKEVGFPVVAKPDNGVGAYHTYKITNESELEHFYQSMPNIKYIMEEFIPGNLISFDGVVDGNSKPIFYSNEVFPLQIMEIVNNDLDCFYFSNKDMPDDLLEQGTRVLKAFGAKYRYFHLEFFRLTKDKAGLGKKGELIGLEVNMRSPGGYTPDIINFSKSVNTYKIWSDIMCFNSTNENMNNTKYYCGYYGRRDYRNYVHSDSEIMNKYSNNIKKSGRMPDVFSKAMGNNFYIYISSSMKELEEIKTFISQLK